MKKSKIKLLLKDSIYQQQVANDSSLSDYGRGYKAWVIYELTEILNKIIWKEKN